MSFSLIWTKAAEEQYEQLKADAESSLRARKAGKKTKATKAEGLFKQVHGCLQKLLNDPRHPGLKTRHLAHRKSATRRAMGLSRTATHYARINRIKD